MLATYKLDECTQSVYSLPNGNPLYLYITFARDQASSVPYGVTCVLRYSNYLGIPQALSDQQNDVIPKRRTVDRVLRCSQC